MNKLPLLLALLPAQAAAIPRFAIRTGHDCGACHVSATGGGMRTAYGRNVFARQWLAPATGEATEEPFSPEINRWLAVGFDARAGYLMQKTGDPTVADTSSFLTMQADMYLSAQVDPRVALYYDQGVYGGFETFVIAHPLGEIPGGDLYVKAGRFVVPFGVRDPDHTRWTRQAVGLGPTDRDNGVEVGAARGPLSLQLALTNGTYGDAFLDAGGTGRTRAYNKAVSGRIVLRGAHGPLMLWAALSAMFNDNVAQQNPLFAPALFPGNDASLIVLGVNEWRAGAFLGAGLGRLTYEGEIVGVRDTFVGGMQPIKGYTSLQEIAVAATRRLDLAATYEFADPDVDFARGRIERVGGVVEWFPSRGLELRLMMRRTFGPRDLLPGGATRHDAMLLAHLYF